MGKTHFLQDTVRVKEIIVKSSSKPSVLNGFMDHTIDSMVLKDYKLTDISSVISENTPLFVKNYGPGAISTISFRGTGASHTQLLWNDFSINSPMLGQADLSLVPCRVHRRDKSTQRGSLNDNGQWRAGRHGQSLDKT